MRIWMVLSLALAACGGATTSGLFGDGDAGSDAAASPTPTAPSSDAGAPTDAKASTPPPPAPPPSTGDASSEPPPTGASDAGSPPPASDDCPQTSDYAYEYSELAISAPLCGPSHGGACSDPSKDCCYFDYVSNAHVCLPWLRDQ